VVGPEARLGTGLNLDKTNEEEEEEEEELQRELLAS
jgi:hypothetical protein